MAAKDDLGRAGEERAARYLEDLGYSIVDRNWRCRSGELDIVATRADDVVIVEVKTRRTADYGHPFEALGAAKKSRLWRVAMAWIASHGDLARGRRLRFAAVGIIGAAPATAEVELISDLDLR